MEYLTAAAVAIGTFALGIFSNIVASELYDRSSVLARLIIEDAVAQLPMMERDRYREEWMSHLDECHGKLSRLLHAIGVRISVERVSETLAPAEADKDNPTPLQLVGILLAMTVILLGTWSELLSVVSNSSAPLLYRMFVGSIFVVAPLNFLLVFKILRLTLRSSPANATPASRRPDPRAPSRPT